MTNQKPYICSHYRIMTSVVALIVVSLSASLTLASSRSLLPSCYSDRPGWATHRTLYVPRAALSGSAEESSWVDSLCCVYTYVEVTTTSNRAWMKIYDGSSDYVKGVGSSSSSIQIMEAAMNDICTMYMGGQDCNKRSTCIKDAMAARVQPPTPRPSPSPRRAPTPVPTAKPTRNPTPVPTPDPTKSPTKSPTVSPTLSPMSPPLTVKQNCKKSDSTKVIYKSVNKRGEQKKKTCSWIKLGKTLKIRRKRCGKRKGLDGVKVKRACPVTCGEFAGVGKCKFLRMD